MTGKTYIVNEFVNVQAGEPYRLFPFGKIVKNGRARIITPEYAAQFKLPHFKPAIKLGSHDDPTPAGGHIVALEVRADGLYAVPEFNDKGSQALKDGAYRYHSPEVIWDDGAMEDPTSGALINGPLIIGDALLHTPHLGEAAALYGVEIIPQENQNMADESVIEVLKAGFEKLVAMAKGDESAPVAPAINPDEFAAAVKERDEYKALIDKQEAEKAQAERVAKYTTELAATKATGDLAGILAGLTEEQAAAILQQLKALSEQINVTAIAEEKGTEGAPVDDPQAAFNAAVLSLATEKRINYNAAFEAMKAEKPDLFRAAFKK